MVTATEIEDLLLEGHAHGLRADDAVYAVGDVMPDSREWADNDPTGEMIDGTSTVGIDDRQTPAAALTLLARYGGRHIYLVATRKSRSLGQDRGEHILRDATVLAAWTR